MADMRLIVAGAGGRMGRTLVKAISETDGLTLAGALEDARSPLLGWDAGTLAGLGEAGIKLEAEPAKLFDGADGIIDFTVPAATLRNLRAAADHAGVAPPGPVAAPARFLVRSENACSNACGVSEC